MSYSDPEGNSISIQSVENFGGWTSDGKLIFDPLDKDVGIHQITVTIADSYGATAEQNFSLTVNNINDPPDINPMLTQHLTEGQTFSYQVIASDPDFDSGDSITFTAIGLPDWLSLSQTGFLTGTVPDGDVGEYSIEITATDSFGTTDTQTLEINVGDSSDSELIYDDYADQPYHQYWVYLGANTEMLSEFRAAVGEAVEWLKDYEQVGTGEYPAGHPIFVGPFTGVTSAKKTYDDIGELQLSGRLNYLSFGENGHQISRGEDDSPGIEFSQFNSFNPSSHSWLTQSGIKNTGIYASDFLELLNVASQNGEAADVLFEGELNA